MAVRFDATGDYFSRSSGTLLNYNSTFTMMGWFYMITDLNTYSVFMSLSDGVSFNRYDILGTNSDGSTLRVSETSTGTNGSSLSLNTWYHLALVRTSVTQTLGYINGAVNITHNHATVAGTPAVGLMEVGDNIGGASNQFNGRVMGLKYWSRALVANEIKAEMRRIQPVFNTSVYGWWPIYPGATERTRDYGPNQYAWTANGTLTDEASPPLPIMYPAMGLPWKIAAPASRLPFFLQTDLLTGQMQALSGGFQ